MSPYHACVMKTIETEEKVSNGIATLHALIGLQLLIITSYVEVKSCTSTLHHFVFTECVKILQKYVNSMMQMEKKGISAIAESRV